MAKGRVLIIDGDEWVARLLASGLQDHGFEVSTCLSGGSALEVARAVEPDCVITEMVLPEIDGPTVLRAIRADESGIYTTPVVVLSNADDTSTRLAAFHAGGDVYLTKPFRVDEVAMQVLALIALAARCRGRRDTFTSLESSDGPQSVVPGGHAIEGNVGQMSIATVLTLLEMEHRSGVLTISSRGRKCTLEMIGGCPAAATVGGVGVSPLALLRTVLRWKEGRFRFRPGTEGAVPSNRRSIGALLIEAVRLDDESAEELRDGTGEDEAPTARRGAVPSAPPPSSRRGASLGVAQKRASRPPVARPPRR